MSDRLLQNEEICLRALEPEDLELFFKWENDTSYWDYANTIAPISRFALKQYIVQAQTDTIYESKQLKLVIERRSDRLVLGMLDLFDFDIQNQRAEIGFLVDVAYQNNTYATQAISLLIAYAFDFLSLHQLYCHVPVTNLASVATLKKLGFCCVGEKKDWVKEGDAFVDACFFQLLK